MFDVLFFHFDKTPFFVKGDTKQKRPTQYVSGVKKFRVELFSYARIIGIRFKGIISAAARQHPFVKGIIQYTLIVCQHEIKKISQTA